MGQLSDRATQRRPIGWWLKVADTQLDPAFDRALGETAADRRSWQILASLRREPMRRAQLVGSLVAALRPPT